jgi:hypothetical protein
MRSQFSTHLALHSPARVQWKRAICLGILPNAKPIRLVVECIAFFGLFQRKEANMKFVLYFLGALLILGGGVWFLQGINVLPGSFMTGQIEWAFYGALSILVGIGLIVFASRRKTTPPGDGPE